MRKWKEATRRTEDRRTGDRLEPVAEPGAIFGRELSDPHHRLTVERDLLPNVLRRLR
jgi:hypothetical protein